MLVADASAVIAWLTRDGQARATLVNRMSTLHT